MGLHKLILPETNWLQELIIGYTLCELKSVDKIFVHKKLHNVPYDGNESKGIESDVSIITKDGRLILIEVTTQTSFDNIMKDVTRKISNLEEREIPFDALAFITPYTLSKDEYLTVGKKNAKIFMAKHIQNLPNLIDKELIKTEDKE